MVSSEETGVSPSAAARPEPDVERSPGAERRPDVDAKVEVQARSKPGRSAAKPRGRPRSFDRATALEKALMAFWEHGYEATSVSDLTRVMDIGTPSLYAAFGDKRSLFEEVVREYGAKYGSFGDRALAEEPTARAAIERMLHEAAVEYTVPGRPHGCLVIHAATNCSTPEVEESLRERRNANIAAFESRIAADVAAGVLPPDTDAAALARHAGAMIQGMSQQARDGASREELKALAEIAMSIWPRS
ncbi:TetR/AcrR family transcriptional regulator [Streptomyces sp. S.PNR 29]|uniref:TetR/AcrR family transcriptional regulator n=1 Tax=Streptomyces sp. S.PNR 29 TaxID=2973805 RepID=UPI0025AFDC88|nr:TetR/AcrR family transcriptional regulator [Streptomyces sp. S.PNR 29]MDN0195671.1 TetR/AcrR family transcriptional regulator [Streptomyces sp. S.PNR 29]